jgi:hypothetical protein
MVVVLPASVYFGLADALENLLVLSMSFAADGERREAFPETFPFPQG